MTPPRTPPAPVPSDYDENPGRLRLARSVLRRHAVAADIHEKVARRFTAESFSRVLDVGCGEGELARYLPEGVSWIGLDNSPTMLERAPPGGLLGEADALPFPDGSFDGVAILYVLYHLPDPRPALAEAYRVMHPGGLIAVSAPSRHDSPELAHALPQGPLTFDAELAPVLMRELFEELEVMRWDAPLLELPTARAVRDYLVGKQVAPDRAQAVADETKLPLTVTKRGALLFARKPSPTNGRPRANGRDWTRRRRIVPEEGRNDGGKEALGPAEVHRRLVGAYGDILAGRLDGPLGLIDPDVVDHRGGAEGDRVGIGAWREKWERAGSGGGAFRDVSVTVEQNVASGEFSVNRYASRGTHVATGKSYEVLSMDMIRVKNGKVVEHWALRDSDAMRSQLGLDDCA